MASRSVTVVLKNATGLSLWYVDASLSHGEWDVNVPVAVHPGALAAWTSQSDGFLTGTQGSATFNTGPYTPVFLTLNWDNPYAGGNSYGIAAPARYLTSAQGGGGDNAVVVFVVADG